jgi:hypothetical protein
MCQVDQKPHLTIFNIEPKNRQYDGMEDDITLMIDRETVTKRDYHRKLYNSQYADCHDIFIAKEYFSAAAAAAAAAE